LLHWFNVFFKSLRGCGRAKSAVGINENGSPSGRGGAKDLADKAAIVYVHTSGADTNNVIGRGDVQGGQAAQCDIVAAGGIRVERRIADSRVAGAGGVAKQRVPTAGRVGAAGVVKERLITRRRIASAGSVVKERVNNPARRCEAKRECASQNRSKLRTFAIPAKQVCTSFRRRPKTLLSGIT
jgi:hypothetical protein